MNRFLFIRSLQMNLIERRAPLLKLQNYVNTTTVRMSCRVDILTHISRMEFPTFINWTGRFLF